jgi:hypothetical protein
MSFARRTDGAVMVYEVETSEVGRRTPTPLCNVILVLVESNNNLAGEKSPWGE